MLGKASSQNCSLLIFAPYEPHLTKNPHQRFLARMVSKFFREFLWFQKQYLDAAKLI